MSKMHNEQDMPLAMPAAAVLPEALTRRFLAAMQAASDECACGGEAERILRRLQPAPLTPAREKRLRTAMKGAAAPSSYSRVWRYVQRWGAAAAVFIIGVIGVASFASGQAEARSASGIACRSVVESRVGGSVQWHEGQTAVRHCEVLYEDSFVLDDGEDSTITVRVPNRTRVLVEDEVI